MQVRSSIGGCSAAAACAASEVVAVAALCMPDDVARGGGGDEPGCAGCAVARGGCGCNEVEGSQQPTAVSV